MDEGSSHQELLSLTTEIVSSFVGNSKLATADLPTVISSVFEALHKAGKIAGGRTAEAPIPAVAVKKSVSPDFIICLEDGKKLKMLKRHLATRYSMTPDDYRRRWGLAADYPMVAPAYAAARAAVAKRIGFGRKPAVEPRAPEPAPVAKGPGRRAAGRRNVA